MILKIKMQQLKRIEKLLLFLTILFLPTQLGKHVWPQFSFVYSLPIDYLSPIFYFWDLLVIFLWIIFLLSKQHINKLALTLYYFFLLTQALSLIFNPNGIGVGLVRLEQYMMAGLFGVYVASSNLKTKLSLPLILAVLFESILAILQFLKGGTLELWILGERTFSLSTPAIAKFDFYGREFLRPYGTFPHPNVLAGFLVISIVILSGRFRMTLVKVAVILAIVGILLTVSRTAIVAGLISALVLVKNKIRILIIIGVVILLPILFTRFSSLINYDNLTFIRREELSKAALILWFKSPLFGVGLNNFIPAGSELLLAGPSRFLQPVHNIFLLSLSETGIIGLIGLLSLIGYPILRRKLLLIWATIFFLGLFDHYFLTLPQGYRMLFLIWGLSLSMLELKSEV